MDRDQTYFTTFLEPANPYRFGTERFAMPRMKKTIRHANSTEDIARGYKFGIYGPYALKRLDSYGWSKSKQTGTAFNALRCSISRRDRSKIRKKWFFATYPDASSVSFLQFDIDRHYSSEMLPGERAEMDHAFRFQVQCIKEMATDVGCDVVFTTSPGDISLLPEKKEKQVVVGAACLAMYKSCPEHASLLIASISTPNHDWSVEFT